MRTWPSGWVCHAVRAPGSNVTLAPAARAGACAWNNGSIRTVPVNQSAGPLLDGCEPILLISIYATLLRLGTAVTRSLASPVVILLETAARNGRDRTKDLTLKCQRRTLHFHKTYVIGARFEAQLPQPPGVQRFGSFWRRQPLPVSCDGAMFIDRWVH